MTGVSAMVRRFAHGPVISELDACAAGIPASLDLNSPVVSPAELRHTIAALVDFARVLAIHLDATVRNIPAEDWLVETQSPATLDLGAVVGVSASRLPSYKLDVMAGMIQVSDYDKPNRPAVAATLYADAVREGLDTPPRAMRFGASSEIYLCNHGGSHRLAAVRDAYRRQGKAQLLDVMLCSIGPGEALQALLARFDIVAALVEPVALATLLGRDPLYRDRFSIAAELPVLGTGAIAVIRRHSRAARVAAAMIDQHRAFGLRQFLAGQGCKLESR